VAIRFAFDQDDELRSLETVNPVELCLVAAAPRKSPVLGEVFFQKSPDPNGDFGAGAVAIRYAQRRPVLIVRVAQQVSHAFGLDIDKDVVRRVLAKHYRPGDSGTNGPSWLTFIGHFKDSLWSVDLFRCESILLRSHWVLVVMRRACASSPPPTRAVFSQYAWQEHCQGPFHPPISA
jgi:hypothetical protein